MYLDSSRARSVRSSITMAETKFHIREVCHNPTDGDFIVAAFDSALPHLASIGSGDQWGSTPFSERAEYRQRMYDSIPLSEASRLNQESSEHGRLFIAEVETHHGSTCKDYRSGRTTMEIASSWLELPS